MGNQKIKEKFLVISIFSILMFAVLQFAWHLSVEKKPFYVIAWDLLAGGSLGATAGFLFFFLFGGIGWVSGAFYGAIGLFSLLFGSALGGLGLGSLIHLVRNPENYYIDWYLLTGILIVGAMFCIFTSVKIGSWVFDKLGSNVEIQDAK